MDIEGILKELKSKGNPANVAGMARYGIRSKDIYGVPIPAIRNLAKKIGVDHDLASALWKTANHEARLLACLIDDPTLVSEQQMDRWVQDFDSWDLCDQCCSNLLDKTPYAHAKALEYSKRDEEYVKRAGFTLMATLAVHDKKSGDEAFMRFLPTILKGSTDDRNYVKKAVNWALRQVGKRNKELNKKAIEAAKKMQKLDSKSARWIASDALRELTGEKVQQRLAAKR